MNLLCPNCQKMLTVPEQFAGQLMKCPLCSGTFTVPALPPPGTSEPAPAFAAAPPPPSVPASAPSLPVEPPVPAFTTPSAPEPATYRVAPPEPAFATSPPPAQSSAPALAPTSPAPAPAPRMPVSAPAPSHTPAPLVGYRTTLHLSVNPRILQWVPAVAMVLIFILQLFPWVGIYPGGVRAVAQDAWDAAFGWATPELDMKDVKTQFLFPIVTEAEAKKANEGKKETDPQVVVTRPGFSWLTFFYLIPFFIVTFLVTIFVAVQPFLTIQLPPQVQQLLPWKWAILTGLNAVLLLFLGLQLVLSFDLEYRLTTWVDNKPELKRDAKNSKEFNEIKAEKGTYLAWGQRTIWLKLVFVLHLLATASAALVYWMERRGPGRPAPFLEVRW